jgi:hypothetical protein
MHHFFRNRMVNIGILLERQLGRLLDESRAKEAGHAH